MGAKRNEKGELVDHALYTIFIQSEDLFGDSDIDTAGIRDKKNRVDQEVLDIPFGNTRLYCVASRSEALSTKMLEISETDEVKDSIQNKQSKKNKNMKKNTKKNTRVPFVSYPTDEGMMLPNVMLALDPLRNHQKLDDNAVMLKFSNSKDE